LLNLSLGWICETNLIENGNDRSDSQFIASSMHKFTINEFYLDCSVHCDDSVYSELFRNSQKIKSKDPVLDCGASNTRPKNSIPASWISSNCDDSSRFVETWRLELCVVDDTSKLRPCFVHWVRHMLHVDQFQTIAHRQQIHQQSNISSDSIRFCYLENWVSNQRGGLNVWIISSWFFLERDLWWVLWQFRDSD
jgi:hypothetical protein